MIRKLCILLWLIASCLSVQGNIFRNYQMENGLSHNSVWAVVQDSKGFMWFGTKDGLNRFDGKSFKVYRKQQQNSQSIGHNFIRSIKEDSRNRFLIGTGQGLYLFDRDAETFSLVEMKVKGILSSELLVNDIVEDKSGNIWLACFGQGIIVLDRELEVKHHYSYDNTDQSLLPSNFIWSIVQDQDGAIWVGTIGAGVVRFSTKGGSFSKLEDNQSIGLSDNTIHALYVDKNHQIWMGTSERGIARYNYATRKLDYFSDRNGSDMLNIKAIEPYDESKLLIGSDNGLVLFDQFTGVFRSLPHDNSHQKVLDKSVFCIARDSEGSFWVGTYYSGVDYLSPAINRFAYYHQGMYKDSGFQGNIISRFAENEKGQIWIGTNDGGVSLFHPSTGVIDARYNATKIDLSYSNVQTLLLDRNKLWVGLYSKGIDVLDLEKNQRSNYYPNPDVAQSLATNNISYLFRKSDGEILVATPVGVEKYNPRFNDFARIPELNGQHVKDIIQDYRGNLWFATNDKGLFMQSTNGDWRNFSHNPQGKGSLSSNTVNCIFEDVKRRIWVGTEGGGLCLYRPDDGTFDVLDERHGLPNSVIYALVDDIDGNIWMSTNKGIVKINPDTKAVKTVGYVDELLKIYYNYGAALRASNNKLYFGGTNGFVMFDPADIVDNPVVPRVIISGFQLFNKEVPFGVDGSPLKTAISSTDAMTLSHDQATFSFDFVSLSYLSPMHNQYAYMLEGFDKEWNYVGNNNKASYMNIPPGDYTFRVKASNNDGIWSEETTSISMRIMPPVWRTIPVLLLYFVLIAMVSWYLISQYNKRVKAENQEKLFKYKTAKEKEIYESKINFFTNIAHEIRTPLSLIVAPLENVIRSGDGNTQTKSNLEIMERNANRLLELVNQLLDFRKIEEEMFRFEFRNYNVVEIVRKTFGQYSQHATINDIDMRLVVDEDHIVCKVDAEAIRKIVSNLVSNAVKHARKKVVVSVRRLDNALQIAVEDDGIGMNAGYVTKIFEPFYQIDNQNNAAKSGSGLGLTISQSLASGHGGEVQVSSVPGEGSVFILVIPMHSDTGLEVYDDAVFQDQVSSSLTNAVAADRVTILLVEDNRDLLAFVNNTLSDTYCIFEANNGLEALAVVEREDIDIVISDIVMPEMDGLELCKAIKSNPAYSYIPLILLSAKNDTAVKIKGLEYGADVYVEKPFSVEQLRAQISSIIGNRNHVRDNLVKSPLQFYIQQGGNTEKARFIDKLNSVINEHLTDPNFSIDQLSGFFAMSRSNLHKKIKSITGITPNDYIKLIRLNKAAQMLLTGEYKINEVCYLVGFNTPSYFSKCFYEQFGKLPRDFVEERQPT